MSISVMKQALEAWWNLPATEVSEVTGQAFKAGYQAAIAEQEKAEPVAWFDNQYGDFSRVNRIGWEPLFTHPAPVPAGFGGADATRIAELIGSIFFYGNFKAETYNERELETLLRKHGFFFETEDQLHSNVRQGAIK